MEGPEPKVRRNPGHHKQKRVLHQRGPKKDQNRDSEASLDHKQLSLILKR